MCQKIYKNLKVERAFLERNLLEGMGSGCQYSKILDKIKLK